MSYEILTRTLCLRLPFTPIWHRGHDSVDSILDGIDAPPPLWIEVKGPSRWSRRLRVTLVRSARAGQEAIANTE